jgi:hypothetical protein
MSPYQFMRVVNVLGPSYLVSSREGEGEDAEREGGDWRIESVG